nr:pentatricopeptide repeat-containing protein At1g06143-like [Ipomoea batatas]
MLGISAGRFRVQQKQPVSIAKLLEESSSSEQVESWYALIIRCVRLTLLAQKNQHVSVAKLPHKFSAPKQLESLYGVMIKVGLTKDCFLMNRFISASAVHDTDFAIRAFSQMENRNVFVYTSLMRAFVHCNRPLRAMELYAEMLTAQIRPNSYAFSSIVKSCSLLGAFKTGETVHGQVWKHGFGSHVHVLTCLVDFYSNLGKVIESRLVFDEIPERERDSVSWIAMVSALVRERDLDSAREVFDKMPERITASWNTMIHGYASVGDVESAELFFNQMPERDLISWTTMIKCYSQNKRYRDALEVFGDMKNNGITPDEVTMTTIISACAHIGVLDYGKEMHLYVMQNGFDLDVYIGSALVDMYAKCGSLEKSLVVFFKLHEKNLFCWNSVIDGLAVHGYAEEALAMFSTMEKEKIRPNGVTFVSVLAACSHAGLVEEGRRRFLDMIHRYEVLPEMKHYGCMVDLLCKAGLLEETLEVIKRMRVEPNAVVWGALLGGCRLHKNLDIAQVALDNLAILEPNNTGYYTLLLNMYAEANRWSEVSRIRATLKTSGVEKECPGSSWIELEKAIHQFSACDNYHPASQEIYSLLDGLFGQLKRAECVPEAGFIL